MTLLPFVEFVIVCSTIFLLQLFRQKAEKRLSQILPKKLRDESGEKDEEIEDFSLCTNFIFSDAEFDAKNVRKKVIDFSEEKDSLNSITERKEYFLLIHAAVALKDGETIAEKQKELLKRASAEVANSPKKREPPLTKSPKNSPSKATK